MFTGIIEEIGYIRKIEKGIKSASLHVEACIVLENISIGDSIATDGVCLTVKSFEKSGFAADLMPETMSRTNFDRLVPGSPVNLERAMTAEGRFGGHIVSGHTDGKGIITEFKKDDNAVWVNIKADLEILKYVVEKGSITVDGISLTVAYVNENMFKVSVIPTTACKTTLINKKAGDSVNLECDIVGKYVEKLFNFNNEKKVISKNFLMENGFI